MSEIAATAMQQSTNRKHQKLNTWSLAVIWPDTNTLIRKPCDQGENFEQEAS